MRIVVIAVLIAAGLIAVAYVVAAERRTAWLGRVVTRIWRFVLGLLRRPEPPDFVERMVSRGYTKRQVRRLVEWYMRVKKSG